MHLRAFEIYFSKVSGDGGGWDDNVKLTPNLSLERLMIVFI